MPATVDSLPHTNVQAFLKYSNGSVDVTLGYVVLPTFDFEIYKVLRVTRRGIWIKLIRTESFYGIKRVLFVREITNSVATFKLLPEKFDDRYGFMPTCTTVLRYKLREHLYFCTRRRTIVKEERACTNEVLMHYSVLLG